MPRHSRRFVEQHQFIPAALGSNRSIITVGESARFDHASHVILERAEKNCLENSQRVRGQGRIVEKNKDKKRNAAAANRLQFAER